MSTPISAPIAPDAPAPARRISLRTRVAFILVAWMVVLLPFLFWRSTWFGRPLPDAELDAYLHDSAKPRHAQHALVQIGERLARGDAASVAQWYPDLLRLATSPVEEVRTTDAWVMGQAPQQAEFHAALLLLLRDTSLNVRNNAALALVRYGDASGHDQVVAMLRPASVTAGAAGSVLETAKPGEPIRGGTMLVRIQSAAGAEDLRSPITGTVNSIKAAKGTRVAAGAEVATVSPGTDQVWEALRGLYFIGQASDLPAVHAYERPQPGIAARVAQQARETEQAIKARSRLD